jgi:hypothetical protein
VREGDWKLIEHYEDGSTELFNVANDPRERTNRAGERPRQVAELRAKLAAWRKAVGAQENAANPNFDAALHRKCYIDTDPPKYDPAKATPREFAQMQTWRKQMDAVVPKRKK